MAVLFRKGYTCSAPTVDIGRHRYILLKYFPVNDLKFQFKDDILCKFIAKRLEKPCRSEVFFNILKYGG